MLRAALEFIIVMVVTRALWRLVGGVIQGMAAGSRPASPDRSAHMVRDPVCGTFVLPERAVALAAGGQQLYFCSTACRDAHQSRSAPRHAGTARRAAAP